MFENIYEAEDYILGFDIYTDMSIRGTQHYNFTGNDTYNEIDNRKLIMQITVGTDEPQLLNINYKAKNRDKKCIELPFQYVFSFVIDINNLYVGSMVIPLKDLTDIYCCENNLLF